MGWPPEQGSGPEPWKEESSSLRSAARLNALEQLPKPEPVGGGRRRGLVPERRGEAGRWPTKEQGPMAVEVGQGRSPELSLLDVGQEQGHREPQGLAGEKAELSSLLQAGPGAEVMPKVERLRRGAEP